MSPPPVMSSHLVNRRYPELRIILNTEPVSMTVAWWTVPDIGAMEEDHRDLMRAVLAKPALRYALAACKDVESLSDN